MKTIEESEKLICPFISTCVATADNAGNYIVLCKTDKCMAWKTTDKYERTR